MLTWMIYAVLVTMALSAAALAAERAAKVRRTSTRWIWLAALGTSLLLPMLMASVSITMPRAFTPHDITGPIALREATFIALPSGIVDFGGAGSTASVRIDTWVRYAWAAGSLLLLLVLVISSTLLHRRKRGWAHGQLCGEAVLIAPDAGPAVVGLVRSRIVLPVWVMQAPAEQQAYVVAHERSHLEAHDPQLVMLALAALTIMPWNPLLWWQLHRMRRAIEVDCDARVLRSGRDVGAYCEALIEVGQNQSASMGMASAMSESTSFLEQRIRIMLRKPKKWARLSALALVSMSLGMAAFAAQLTPPDTSAPPAGKTVTISAAVLASHIGFYAVSDLSLVTITRHGNGLTLSMSGQVAVPEPLELTPVSDTRFAVPAMNATVDFLPATQGRPATVVGHMNGREVLSAARVDKAAADRINAALAKRIREQKPFPGSEKALRLLLSDPESGAGMSQDVARIRQEQKPSREKYLAKLGPVQSYTFAGVSRFGSDTYTVKHKNGSETVLLVVDKDGTLATVYRHP